MAKVSKQDHPPLSSDSGSTPKIAIGDLLARIGDCFCELDSEFRVTYINTQAADLWGGAQIDFVGKRLLDVVALPVGGETLAHLVRAMVDQEPHQYEILSPIVKRWIEFDIHPSGDGLAVFIRDIHARKVAQIALHESEERFRHLADLVPNIIWTAKADGAMEYVNLRWRHYTGRTSPPSSEWTWLDAIHPDDRARVTATYHAALLGKVMCEAEMRLRDVDGVYRWHLGRILPVKNSHGTVKQWVGALTDISGQKQLQESFRHGEALLEEAQRVARIGSWEINVATNTRIWSNGLFHLFGLEPADVAPDHASVLALFHPDDRLALDNRIAQSVSDGIDYDMEIRGAPRGGEPPRCYHVTCRSMRGADGSIARRFGTVTDITERKLDEERRQRPFEETGARAERLARADEAK